MITHRATLDVSQSLLVSVTGLVARARRGPGARPRQRAVGVQRQALLVLRWLRDAPPVWRLGRDAGVSRATAYRYLHEALAVLAEQAPTLQEAIEAALEAGAVYICLDGTLVPTDRVAARKTDARHLFYSGKHKAFGVNVQVIANAAGDVIWVSPGSPGCTHDLSAARAHVLQGLAPYISRHTRHDGSRALVVLADKGYVGADVAVLTPTKRRKGVHPLANPGDATRSQLVTSLRAEAERANAQLTVRWKALRRVSLDPAAVGTIAAAAALTLVLFEREHGR